MSKTTWIILLVLVLGGGPAAGWYFLRDADSTTTFRTAQIGRGNLVVSINATGTVEPEEAIDVGAQVGGKIVAFGPDIEGKPTDYCSRVQKGSLLAMIDDVIYRADVEQSQAAVDSAKAGIARAQADLQVSRAKLAQAESDWTRAQKLGPSEALAQATYDGYRSAYEVAKATVGVSEAAVVQAQASLKQANNALDRANRNLGYCTITSPVDGVVIDRRVNVGQTVNAGLSAPSLFLIARDMKRMQVWVAVNEADIDSIYAAQPVTFTVDGLQGDPVTFVGQVRKVRYNAAMTQNVVTYTVEIETDNSAGRLLPYRTANVQFQLDRADDVLLVPNAALRFVPTLDQVAPQYRADYDEWTSRPSRGSYSGRQLARATSRPDRGTNGRDRPSGSHAHRDAAPDAPQVVELSATRPEHPHPMDSGVLWVQDGGQVRPVRVRLGITDGANTHVQGEGLAEGMDIVTGVRAADASEPQATNPFMPKMPNRRDSARNQNRQESDRKNNSDSGNKGSGSNRPVGPPPM